MTVTNAVTMNDVASFITNSGADLGELTAEYVAACVIATVAAAENAALS